MADPLSIVASVLAIATAAVQSSKALFELVDDIRGGHEEIKSISKDAHSFHSIIHSFSITLKNASIREIISDDDGMLEMIKDLESPLFNCEEALSELMVKLQKRLKLDTDRRGLSRSIVNVKWGLFTKSEVRRLQLRLEAAKSTLNSAMSAISVYRVYYFAWSENNSNDPKNMWRTLVSDE